MVSGNFLRELADLWHDTPWTVKGSVIFAVVLLLMV